MKKMGNGYGLVKKTRNWLIYCIYIIVLLEIAARFFLWFSLSRYCEQCMPAEYQGRMKRACAIVSQQRGRLCSAQYTFDPVCYMIPKDEKFFRGRGPYETAQIALPKEKEPDEVRIMCLGTSTTYGLAVSYENSWPYLLEQKLQRRYPDKKITVLNCGFPGAQPRQIKRIFQLYLVDYAPDIVLTKFYFEVCDSYNIAPTINPAKYWIWRLLHASRLFRSVCVLTDEIIDHVSWMTRCDTTSIRVYDFLFDMKKEYQLAHEEYQSGLAMIDAIAKEHGIPFVIAVEDLSVNKNGELGSCFARKSLSEIGLTKYIPLWDVFSDALARMPLRSVFIDSAHVTPVGTHLVADQVYNYIVNDDDMQVCFMSSTARSDT